MDFEEWFESRDDIGCLIGLEGYAAEQAWNARQAEIDALKAKIDELEKWSEFHIEDYNLSESKSEHDRGWFNAACQVSKKLKENDNDT